MSAAIHPTAVIATGAEIEDDCEIGPYCFIGGHVRLGQGTRIHSHAVIDGCTRIGAGCQIFSFASIGKASQDLKYSGDQSYVVIGAGTTLREYVTVNAATEAGGSTRIGANCHILAYSHVAHDCCISDNVIISNATQLAGHVTIDESAVLGGMVGVHQFVHIGKLAMVSATSKVVQDILPFCLADGHPASLRGLNKIGLQRNGKGANVIDALGKVYKVLFRSALTLDTALQRLQDEFCGMPEIAEIIAFAQGSERGLARPKRAERN